LKFFKKRIYLIERCIAIVHIYVYVCKKLLKVQKQKGKDYYLCFKLQSF